MGTVHDVVNYEKAASACNVRLKGIEGCVDCDAVSATIRLEALVDHRSRGNAIKMTEDGMGEVE